MHELVVKGGRIARDEGWAECDVGIDNGRITALEDSLAGQTVIDAAGLWVMPGGIDTHCHLDQPSWGGAMTADDFESGSISAAFGGTTCMIPFAMPGPDMDSFDAFQRSMRCADGRSVIDYSLHGVVTMETGSDLDRQFESLVREGIASVKVFMTYEGFAVSDDLFLAVLDRARKFGLTIMVHAENDAAIRRTRRRLIELGRTDIRYHTVAHSEIMEREATNRAIAFAEITGGRLTVVHVSSMQSAEEVARGKKRGAHVFAETCPQYLFLDGSALDQEPAKAARYIFSPPPRSRTSREHLWNELASGGIDLWSSDHSPFRLADKLPDPGHAAFHKAVSGIPGIETRLPLLFSEGLLTGRLSLDRYLDLASRNAAEIYGLAHLKGRILPGLDADLALWNPAAQWRLNHEVLHSNVDFTPYEGMSIRGKPTTVLVRGAPVILNGSLYAQPGLGRFIPCRMADLQQFRNPIEETTPWLDI